MTCYLIRHGKDDETLRGGWCDASLSKEGIAQVEALAKSLTEDSQFRIGCIFSSDLIRTKETAEIIKSIFCVPVEFCPQFREVNNGFLAGMRNEVASVKYPGLYWSTLGWEEHYPGGESPKEFYERISSAWTEFKDTVKDFPYNVLLVTHGGVMSAIQCLEHGIPYSNKTNPYPVSYAEMVAIEI